MRGSLERAVDRAADEAMECAAENIAAEPAGEPEAGIEVEDKYPVWIRLSILGAAIVLSWALVVLFAMALMGD